MILVMTNVSLVVSSMYSVGLGTSPDMCYYVVFVGNASPKLQEGMGSIDMCQPGNYYVNLTNCFECPRPGGEYTLTD